MLAARAQRRGHDPARGGGSRRARGWARVHAHRVRSDGCAGLPRDARSPPVALGADGRGRAARRLPRRTGSDSGCATQPARQSPRAPGRRDRAGGPDGQGCTRRADRGRSHTLAQAARDPGGGRTGGPRPAPAQVGAPSLAPGAAATLFAPRAGPSAAPSPGPILGGPPRDGFHRGNQRRRSVYAIINDRGNQATVREGDVLRLDLQGSYEPGQKITFSEVLLVGNEGSVKIGKPTVAGASVSAEVLGLEKGPKLIAF